MAKCTTKNDAYFVLFLCDKTAQLTFGGGKGTDREEIYAPRKEACLHPEIYSSTPSCLTLKNGLIFGWIHNKNT